MAAMADATFTAVDLSRMPAPDIVEELSFETLVAQAVAQMKAEMLASGLTFERRDSDPATKLLQTFAYFAQLLRQRINDATRAVMPAYAVGTDLDNIAALFGIARLTIAPADPLTGTPILMESDADFRRRMVLAPEGYSVAGPEGAYVFHALSAAAGVLDASATSPSPGVVIVSVLSRQGNGAAAQDLLDTVEAYVSAETRRPLTDFVTVQSAGIVPYAVNASIKTFGGPDSGVVMKAARDSLDAFIANSQRLGRDIPRSALFRALHVEGVQNVTLASPAADVVIGRTQAAYCTGIALQFSGVDE
jgi:phage-related baseplate assembly protein